MNVECNLCGKEHWLEPKEGKCRTCRECINARNRARRKTPKYVVGKNNKTLEKHGQDSYDNIPSCKLCELELHMDIGKGYKSNDLVNHIIKFHDGDVENYKRVFNSPIRSNEYLSRQSELIKGDKNPGYQHGGKFSPFSSDFYVRKGHTEEESIILSKQAQQNKVYVKGNSKNQKEYWIKQGYKEQEAIKKVSEVQTKFSKEICIDKYGEDEGMRIWQERQDKWIKTLNDKSDEEKERIYKAKMNNGKSYSKISQKLFISLYEVLGDRYHIRFATLKGNGNVKDDGNNNEYMVITNSGNCRFLDFYARDIDGNEWNVEFNGDYWHNKNRYKGNVNRDEIREQQILETKPHMNIFHVKECDYKNDPDLIVQKCLDFIEKGINTLHESTR